MSFLLSLSLFFSLSFFVCRCVCESSPSDRVLGLRSTSIDDQSGTRADISLRAPSHAVAVDLFYRLGARRLIRNEKKDETFNLGTVLGISLDDSNIGFRVSFE